jgi:predicted transposase/invertase (TIGR01784 family)
MNTAKKDGLEEGEAIGIEKGRAEGEAIGLQKGEAIGLQKGRAEGRAEGETIGILKTAKKMKEEGLDVNVISKLTNLSVDEIVKL